MVILEEDVISYTNLLFQNFIYNNFKAIFRIDNISLFSMITHNYFKGLIILPLYMLFVSNLCLLMRANTRSEEMVCYKFKTQGCWYKNAATHFT